jgi:hypothetical protein
LPPYTTTTPLLRHHYMATISIMASNKANPITINDSNDEEEGGVINLTSISL